MPEWHATAGGDGGGGGGDGVGGGGGGAGGRGGGGMQTSHILHLHQTWQSLSLHHGEQPGRLESPCCSERHWPGGSGGGGECGGGGCGDGRHQSQAAHLHHEQCWAASDGWHMLVQSRFDVSPVCSVGHEVGSSKSERWLLRSMRLLRVAVDAPGATSAVSRIAGGTPPTRKITLQHRMLGSSPGQLPRSPFSM